MANIEFPISQLRLDELANCTEIYKYADDNGIIDFITHPLVYADTLIRLGYEPLPPIEKRSLFGLSGPKLVFPGVIPYVRYISFAGGFFGLYRCVIPCVFRKCIYTRMYKLLEAESPINPEFSSENGPQLYERFTIANLSHFAQVRGWNLLCKLAGNIFSHPFHVIAVRCIGAFVGDEYHYATPFRAIYQIYKSDGILGFFSGFAPRLFADVVYNSVSAVFYLLMIRSLQRSPARNPEGTQFWMKIYEMLSNVCASAYSYQFINISDLMIVNGSNLSIGNPPYTPLYKGSWLYCWRNMGSEHLFKSTNFIYLTRTYVGPYEILDGVMTPTDGPLYGPTFLPEKKLLSEIPFLLRDYYAPWLPGVANELLIREAFKSSLMNSLNNFNSI